MENLKINHRHLSALTTLRQVGPQTPFEVAADAREHVHSWAPVFTQLKQAGYTECTGETKRTEAGGRSRVHRITAAGQHVLEVLA
jgi:DNA-binding MarR family transcriptional regulator